MWARQNLLLPCLPLKNLPQHTSRQIAFYAKQKNVKLLFIKSKYGRFIVGISSKNCTYIFGFTALPCSSNGFEQPPDRGKRNEGRRKNHTADFVIDKTYTFEIGGKNKTKKQIANVENAYVAKDSIEIGFGNIIPIWLFGFMY